MKLALPRFPSRMHAAGAIAVLASGALLAMRPGLWPYPLLAWLVLVVAVAPWFPGWSFYFPVAAHGPRSRPEVALTFDDGPDPRTLPALLELLAAEAVPATFFVVGRRAAAHPEAIRAVLAAGHELGNHSDTHDVLLAARAASRVRREIEGCQQALAAHGVRPLTYRPPVGITSPPLGKVLESLGMRCVAFSCRPVDFGNRRLRDLAGRVLRRVRPGDIVLLHDALPAATPVETWLAEVRRILDGLKAKGLRPVALSRLMGERVMEAASAAESDPESEADADPEPSSPRCSSASIPTVRGSTGSPRTDFPRSVCRQPGHPGSRPLTVEGRTDFPRSVRPEPVEGRPGEARPRRASPSQADPAPESRSPPHPTRLDRLSRLFTLVFNLGYPVLVAGSVALLGARSAALVLLGVHAVGRLRTLRRDLERGRGLLVLAATVAVLLALGAILDDPRYLLAYPSLVNAALFVHFAWSLRGVPIAERFARIEARDPGELDATAIRYCRRVTVVWCAFFVVNGGIATALAAAAPRGVWAAYAGGVSYVLVGLVFAAEYVVRRARFGRFGPGLVDRALARLLSRREVSP
jgi:peptidoglycan/xylan/chitin deacetylase (PgdA/CDA1 family)/uncharacterized membrane protein